MIDLPLVRRDARDLMVAATLIGLIACVRPTDVTPSSAESAVMAPPHAATLDTTARVDPPTVQVRDYAYANTVAIVGWSAEATGYGLRTSVLKDDSVASDHRLFVSTYYLPVSDFFRAVTSTQTLRLAPVLRDAYHCLSYPDCSPYETFGARIPDELLRASRDSMAVKFYGRGGREMTITVHRPLIDAYLKAVDSVTVAVRKK